MEEEAWPEPDYVVESNFYDVESQAECVNQDNRYHYTLELWTEWLTEESPEKGEELRTISARMSERHKERIESLVYNRLLMAAQYLGDEEDKERQKRILYLAKRTVRRTRNRRGVIRARHAEKKKRETGKLSRSKFRERRRKRGKQKHIAQVHGSITK